MFLVLQPLFQSIYPFEQRLQNICLGASFLGRSIFA